MTPSKKILTADEILELQRQRADDSLRVFRLKLAEELKVLEEREARVRSVLKEYTRRTRRIRRLLGTDRTQSAADLRANVTYLILSRYGPLTLTDVTALVRDELGAQCSVDPAKIHQVLNEPGAPFRKLDRGLYEVTRRPVSRAADEEEVSRAYEPEEDGDEGASVEP